PLIESSIRKVTSVTMCRSAPPPIQSEREEVTVPWKINSASLTSWSKVGGITVVARALARVSPTHNIRKRGRRGSSCDALVAGSVRGALAASVFLWQEQAARAPPSLPATEATQLQR